MNTDRFVKTVFASLLVVAFGWGVGYLALAGIEYAKPVARSVSVSDQQALTLVAQVVNPAVPEEARPLAMEKEVTVVIGGDVFFDRGIRAIGDRNGYDSLFDESIKSIFRGADIGMVNLESPMTANPSKTLVNGKTTDSFQFTSSPKGIEALKSANISVVSLANNHADNFLFPGFLETQRYLKDGGISWFGNPWNSTSTGVASVITKDGITIAFVGYHAFQKGFDRVIGEIKRVSGPDVFTIVMPHWGEEYVYRPSKTLQAQARAFIAAGADAVIGSHPHVIMEQEWVGDVPVFYSLGNLLFDQYFSPEVTRGQLVKLHLSRGASGVRLERIETFDAYLKAGKGVIGAPQAAQ